MDTSAHHDTINLELPTAEGVFNFIAEIDLSWRIGDPVCAVREKVTGGEAIYGPFLTKELRTISREFEVERFAEAEQRINGHFAGGPSELRCGITMLSCLVKLAAESSTKLHMQQVTYDDREEERRDAEHRAKRHKAELQKGENVIQHELDVQSALFEQEQARIEQQHALDMERQRMSFYSDALQSGAESMIALRLSSNRDDVNDVIKLMMHQRQVDYDNAHTMLSALLEQRLLNRGDVRDIMARTTKAVADHWSPTPLAAASVLAGQTPELSASSALSVEDAEIVESDEDYDEDDDDDI
ncbi:hypothetical protein ACFXG4_09840 [Nocardia sp. NPDC059246]|uniref:hypothetical protein n=1 Tax=unclassified Nocardia TaxID=2637762 RepID=UPI003687B087